MSCQVFCALNLYYSHYLARSFVFSPDVPVKLDYEGKRLQMEQVINSLVLLYSFLYIWYVLKEDTGQDMKQTQNHHLDRLCYQSPFTLECYFTQSRKWLKSLEKFLQVPTVLLLPRHLGSINAIFISQSSEDIQVWTVISVRLYQSLSMLAHNMFFSYDYSLSST